MPFLADSSVSGEGDDLGPAVGAASSDVQDLPALQIQDSAVLLDHPALVGSSMIVEENDARLVGNAPSLDIQHLARGRVADDHLLRKGRNQLPLLVGSSAEFLQEDLITVRC